VARLVGHCVGCAFRLCSRTAPNRPINKGRQRELAVIASLTPDSTAMSDCYASGFYLQDGFFCMKECVSFPFICGGLAQSKVRHGVDLPLASMHSFGRATVKQAASARQTSAH
jgi:hypothetical protein